MISVPPVCSACGGSGKQWRGKPGTFADIPLAEARTAGVLAAALSFDAAREPCTPCGGHGVLPADRLAAAFVDRQVAQAVTT